MSRFEVKNIYVLDFKVDFLSDLGYILVKIKVCLLRVL